MSNDTPSRIPGCRSGCQSGCLGILLGVGCFVLFGRLLFEYMIFENASGLVPALLAMLIACFLLFMLRYVNDRLKPISTITMFAVATFVLLPPALFALFVILLALTGTEL